MNVVLMAGAVSSVFSCRGIMNASICAMTALAFCFGMLIGLFVRLPVVADPAWAASLYQSPNARNLLHAGGLTDSYLAETITKGSPFHYVPDNRRKELGLKVEETLPGISLNAGLIPDSHNRGTHNRNGGLDQHSEYAAAAAVNGNVKGQRLEGVSVKGTMTHGILNRVEQELPAGRNVLETGHRIDNPPQGLNDANAYLNADEQTIKKSQVANAKIFNKLSDVVSGIQWSDKLEHICPSGFSEKAVSEWRTQIFEGKFAHLTEGCGRMQNRLLTLQDSSKACARYRPNIDQIQGEIYSYHLAKILGINNVPPTVLTVVKSVDPMWDGINQEIAMSQWADDKLVVLTRWIENLQPSYIPEELQEDTRTLVPNDHRLLNKTTLELCELMQWSDLIVFDYLTSNLDRVVNNMFNQQWNSQMMASPAHNLEKDRTSGRLVFLDNESGLLHGYRLLDKYAPFHEALLESLCIFTKSTVDAVENLFLENNIGDELQKSLVLNEMYHEHLPKLPETNVKILNQRIGKIYDKIQRCRIRHGS